MRRGLAALLLLSVFGGAAQTAFGQYPYPYAPPVYGPMPYGPPPMMMPQTYYPPPMYPMPPAAAAPMYQMPPPAPPRPTVFVYGPVDGGSLSAKKAITTPEDAGLMLPSADKSTTVTPTQGSAPQPFDPSGIRKTQLDLDACGPFGCPADGPCDEPGGKDRPVRGHGRFIGEIGAYFLVPFVGNRAAFTTTTGASSGTTDFQRPVAFGPRASVGYLFHTGWGARVNYWYLHGSTNESVSSGDAATTIATPLAAPFQLTSPSATLLQGLGSDQFKFGQRLDVNVVDVEILKECQIFDATFLFSVGARYARILQTYTASRTNAGGNTDTESITAESNFQGWGPTTSVEFIHRLGSTNLCFYANGRSSFLFGTNRFNQDYTTFNTAVSNQVRDSRSATILEAEMGLQYGCNIGHCYFFVRAGGVYQRWFDVGSPVGPNGDLSFVGGTARMGIVY